MDSVPATTTEDIERFTVAEALRLEKIDDIKANENNINRILEYAKAQGAKDKISLLAEIASLRNRLGNPTVGEMSAWAYLAMERNIVAQERAKLDAKENELKGTLEKLETPKSKRNEKGQFV